MDTDSFVLSINTNKVVKDCRNRKDFSDFSCLKKNQEIHTTINKKIIDKLKLKLLEVFGWTNFFV